MYKKLLSGICMIIGMMSASFAECSLEEITGSVSRDQHLFFDGNMGFICDPNHCVDGTVIGLLDPHQIGNGWGGKQNVDEEAYYVCHTGRDHQWQKISAVQIPVCDGISNLDGYVYGQTDVWFYNGVLSGDNVAMVNLCSKSLETKDGVTCNKERDDKYYLFTSADAIYRCKMGEWRLSGRGSLCFLNSDFDTLDSWVTEDMLAKIGMGAHKKFGSYFVSNDQQNIGDRPVFEYVSDRTKMCLWFDYIYFDINADNGSHIVDWTDNENAAKCSFARFKQGKNVEWDDDDEVCKCLTDGYTWDNDKMDCVKGGTTEQNNNEPGTGSVEKPDLYAPDCPADAKSGDNCSAKNAKTAKCMKLGKKDASGNDVLTCAAWDCESDYYLYLKSDGKSQGICHKKSYARNQCAKSGACGNCGANETCVPNEAATPRTNLAGGAYMGCHCAVNNSNIGGGNSVIGDGATTFDVQKLKTATDELDKFFAHAESHKSGWKTADGKFNTTRLASDISAGVVLGTVGGVVSGVVIKKKQVEKGFDALHCTVGGQKIADWGDEFRIGMKK